MGISHGRFDELDDPPWLYSDHSEGPGLNALLEPLRRVYIQPRLQGQQQFLNHNTADEGMERYRQAYVTIEGQNSGLIGVTGGAFK